MRIGVDLGGTKIEAVAAATRPVQNRHGDSSGVRGAALLWPASEEDDGE
jgi:predicted NBD/HSP70 family sugar kinase